MATIRISLTSPRDGEARLIDFLNESLPAECAGRGLATPSRSKIRRLVVAGAVSVDGRTTRIPAASAGTGRAITVLFDTDRAFSEREPDDISFELDESRVLYEDEAIIVVDKPAGLPVEATVVASRDHLHAAVKRYLHRAAGSVHEPYAGLLHRLDRETSGVVILTKTRAANASLHAQFLGHEIRKEYLALASRPTSDGKTAGRAAPNDATPREGDAFRVENRLARITAKSARGKWGPVRTGGDEAITDFEIERVCFSWLAVRAFPLTGRTHQIRVHLSGLGYPLLGDPLYGGPGRVAVVPAVSGNAKTLTVPRVMLHAKTVDFRHPLDGKLLTVSASVPEDFSPFLA